MNDMAATPRFDPTAEDLGHILALCPVNVTVPDHATAAADYILSLRLTRRYSVRCVLACLTLSWISPREPTCGRSPVSTRRFWAVSPAWPRMSGDRTHGPHARVSAR